MSMPRTKDYITCFLRSYMVGAAYNTRGLQNIGFMFALEPVLAEIYGAGSELKAARRRYVANYNCHPFFTPLLLGVFIHMELAIAEGRLDRQILDKLKSPTANTLSAIGDSFFNGSLLAAWSLTCCCLVLAGQANTALALTAVCFVLLQTFKLGGFILGLRNGMQVLAFLRKLNLINLGDTVKYGNACILAVFFWLALGETATPAFAGAGMYLALGAWAVGRLHLPRVLLALGLLALILGLQISGFFTPVQSDWLGW